MRITFFLPHLRVCGGNRYLLNVVTGLAERGFDTCVVPLNGARSCNWFHSPFRIERVAPPSDAYVMFQDGICPEVRGGRRLLAFFSFQNSPAEDANLSRSWDTIITCGSWLTHIAEDFSSSHRIVMIPPGIEPLFSPPDKPAPATNIGLLAHPRPTKGTQFALDQLKPLRSQIRVLAYEKGDFAVNKMLERPTLGAMADLYRECAIWIMPSQSEGFSLPPLEAAACGAVPVALDYGIPYDFPIDNETGVMTKPEALLETVHSLIAANERRDRLRRTATSVAQSMPWSRTVDSWAKLLES